MRLRAGRRQAVADLNEQPRLNSFAQDQLYTGVFTPGPRQAAADIDLESRTMRRRKGTDVHKSVFAGAAAGRRRHRI